MDPYSSDNYSSEYSDDNVYQFLAVQRYSLKSCFGKYSRLSRKIPVLELLFRVVGLPVTLLKKRLLVIAFQALVSLGVIKIKINIEHMNKY